MGTFEFNGEKYKMASKHQKEWGNKLIQELELNGNEVILDLGCGDGILTEKLSSLVTSGRVVGIDGSKGMIETAKKLIKDNLRFVYLDINKMNFVKEFDIIYSNAALHWIKDHERLLLNSYHALKPGGKIMWNFAAKGTCQNFFDIINNIINKPQYKIHFKHFNWPWYMPSKSEYLSLIEKVGFLEFSIIEENADRYFSNVDEMIRWIDQPTLVPFIKYLPSNLKEQFRIDVIDQMIEKTIQADGRCFETFRKMKIKAVK